LLKSGPLSQASLPALLDLSQPTVARLVSSFEREGMVRVAARAAVGRGNPSVTLSLEPDYAYGLGLSLLTDAISMAVVDFSGQVRAADIVPMADMSPKTVVARVTKLRTQLIKKAAIDPERIVGAGVGFPGFFVERPLHFNPATSLSDWLGVDVAEVLSPALGTSVVCDNNGTTGAIAESLLGVGRTCSTFAYCYLAGGFGGGLVVDGRVVRGTRGNAGDFGGVWWLLGDGYPNLERLRSHVAAGGRSFATIEDMVGAIDEDTPGVAKWLEEALVPFAKLSFLLGHILSPEKVVISGRLPNWLANQLAERVVLPASPPRNNQPFPLPTVVASEVDGDPVAIGAAIMPLQALFLA
jgi:predicted NBD/HSP70 family sugar kinase